MVASDNGTELTSNAILKWQKDRKISWHYIALSKLVQNWSADSFNGRMRDEFLNEYQFDSPRHARDLVTPWRTGFNQDRPHSSLAGLTLMEYANRSKKESKPEQSYTQSPRAPDF